MALLKVSGWPDSERFRARLLGVAAVLLAVAMRPWVREVCGECDMLTWRWTLAAEPGSRVGGIGLVGSGGTWRRVCTGGARTAAVWAAPRCLVERRTHCSVGCGGLAMSGGITTGSGGVRWLIGRLGGVIQWDWRIDGVVNDHPLFRWNNHPLFQRQGHPLFCRGGFCRRVRWFERVWGQEVGECLQCSSSGL